MHYRKEYMKEQTDLLTCKTDELVDLKDVRIDTTRPVRERMEEFLQQVGNPYLFKSEGLVIKASFLPQTGRTLTDVLPTLLIP